MKPLTIHCRIISWEVWYHRTYHAHFSYAVCFLDHISCAIISVTQSRWGVDKHTEHTLFVLYACLVHTSQTNFSIIHSKGFCNNDYIRYSYIIGIIIIYIHFVASGMNCVLLTMYIVLGSLGTCSNVPGHFGKYSMI